MKEVVILTQLEVKKEYENKARMLLTEYVRQALSNKNNIMAEAYSEEGNPAVMWLIERWTGSSGTIKIPEIELAKPAKTIYVKDLEPLTKEEWRRAPMKEDTPVTIMLFVDSKTGTEDRFKELYHTAMPQFRNEPGVINYQLSQLENDSTQFVTYEKFRNESAFQYHLHFPPIQPVIDYLNTSIQQPPFQNGLHRLIRFAPFNN